MKPEKTHLWLGVPPAKDDQYPKTINIINGGSRISYVDLTLPKNVDLKFAYYSNIPVLPVAASILDKYKDVAECTGKLLPVLCNQRMNSYLKEIADVCGIHKNLSTHTARHSYATSVCLANGVSMENVAKMLGHADTSVTKHYARVLDQNILKDMQKVNSCLSELAI